MARLDLHNACAACPAPVRRVYYAAQTFVDLVEADGIEAALAVPARLEELRAAVRAFTPFVEAHNANQDHVLSAELAPAREPVCR